MCGQNAASEALPGCTVRSSNHRAGPSPNARRFRGRSSPGFRENVSAPITKARLKRRSQEIIRRRQRENKIRSKRLQIERGAVVDAEPALHRDRSRRKVLSRRRRRQHDQVDRLGVDPALASAARSGRDRQMRGELASAAMWRCLMPVRWNDQLVRRIHLRRQFGIGQDPLGRYEPQPSTTETYRSHETASCAVGAELKRCRRD